MVADRHALRFFVDESALGLGKALAMARRDTIHTGHALIPECPVGVLDPDWIPVIAARRLVVICRDKKLRTKPAEVRALMNGGLRVFCIGGKKDLRTWDWLARIVTNWERMESVIERSGPGPWIYMVNESSLVEFVPAVSTSDTGQPEESREHR